MKSAWGWQHVFDFVVSGPDSYHPSVHNPSSSSRSSSVRQLNRASPAGMQGTVDCSVRVAHFEVPISLRLACWGPLRVPRPVDMAGCYGKPGRWTLCIPCRWTSEQLGKSWCLRDSWMVMSLVPRLSWGRGPGSAWGTGRVFGLSMCRQLAARPGKHRLALARVCPHVSDRSSLSRKVRMGSSRGW